MKRLLAASAAAIFSAGAALADYTLFVVEDENRDVEVYAVASDDGDWAAIRMDGDEGELLEGEAARAAVGPRLNADDVMGRGDHHDGAHITIRDSGSHTHISIIDGDSTVFVDADDDDETSQVVITSDDGERVLVDSADGVSRVEISGADRDAARDFVDDLDDAPRRLRRAMIDALDL